MTAQLKATIDTTPSQPAQEDASTFVINLCSSTTPMALTSPEAPELKRFTFFVSRRREDGRERFRLHMGHFATLTEAEEWVNVVRDIYPGAWAGEAPGKKLRERAAAAAQAAHPATSVPVPALAPVKPVPTAVVEAKVAPLPPTVPTLQPAVKAAPVPVSAPAPVAPAPSPASGVPKAAHPKVTHPKTVATKGPMPPKATHKAPAASAAAPAPAKKGAWPDSNVREVLKSLDENTGETRVMKAPPVKPAAPLAKDPLSDSQVLRILEERRADSASDKTSAAANIELLRPDDTGTRQALREAVDRSEAVSFAVQLQWSVQRIDPQQMPPLAIFSAYTLYTVEGSRGGRKWYGLRLGFFSDAISAKQVASYVRSEFASVAVIPVSAQERDRATTNAGGKSAGGARSKHQPRPIEEFKLLDDTSELKAPTAAKPVAKSKTKTTPLKPLVSGRAPTKPVSASKVVRGKVVRASEKRSPQTLEETLEILGASELAIDDGRGEFLNDTGVRHLKMEQVQQKNSPFARLLERLSEKSRKS